MIEIIHYTDESVEKKLTPNIDNYFDEVRLLLDNLPDELYVNFNQEGIIKETGVGGHAVSLDTINISFDKDFKDKELQMNDLRSTIFHESFHLNQGFTYDTSPFTAIQSAIYEGCATVFEREHAGTDPLYGQYYEHSDEQLASWFESVKKIGNEYFEDNDVWQKWAFYNEDLGERWIIYKLGTWLIDQVLKKNSLAVVDLQGMNADDILSLL
jgi:uncharacterized protein YjaZ